MAKATKAQKTTGPLKNIMNRNAIRFVRDHLETKLIRAGWDAGKASDMVAQIKDQEISDMLGATKVGALGDGTILKWLKDNGPKIMEVVQKIFTLLSLFADKPQATAEEGAESTETAEEGEESGDEDSDEDSDEEESEESDDDTEDK